MSSLIASASPWINDNLDSGSTRKRIPTLRKTVKIRPYAGDVISQAEVSETVIEPMTSIDDTQAVNEERNNKVNDLINQMSNVNADNDGQGLADFKPPPMPQPYLKKDAPALDTARDDSSLKIPRPVTNPFINTTPLGVSNEYNSYYSAYDIPKNNFKGYGITNNGGSEMNSNIFDSRLSEKMNYMIHLLENQENERTANITEEFILYAFLGVFMIYICDSFSRGGKYVR